MPKAVREGGILPKGCVCGHDHHTHRDEQVDLCLECSCSELSLRCQNCGEDSMGKCETCDGVGDREVPVTDAELAAWRERAASEERAHA
jgi:hypothetical protein